jgi:hypothetical protein
LNGNPITGVSIDITPFVGTAFGTGWMPLPAVPEATTAKLTASATRLESRVKIGSDAVASYNEFMEPDIADITKIDVSKVNTEIDSRVVLRKSLKRQLSAL